MLLQRTADRLLGVPVFAKVMGIALALTVLFGLVLHWEIIRTQKQIFASDDVREHGTLEQMFLREHVGLASEVLGRRLLRVMAVAAVVGIVLAWWLARILTRPLQEVVAGARQIERGDMQSRLPVRARDEIGEMAAAFNNMAAALEQKEIVRQNLLRRVIEAGEEERRHLSRDLHDHTGQVLTALIAGLGALEARATDPGHRTSLVSLRELAARTLGDIHDISRALRPAILDDLGLVAALEKHCSIVAERFGVPVDFQCHRWDDDPRPPSEIAVALYRIAQEALTNAVRHAGASRIQVLMKREPASVSVTIEDDGCGFDVNQHDPSGDKLGLIGVRERAALLGGGVCLETAPGQGTRLTVEIPVPHS